jgi:hypothetical protein
MLTVAWPAQTMMQAQIWRILDLSGLTNSPRESKNFTRAGYVFLNHNPVLSLEETIEVGTTFRLELRFPNGIIKAETIFLTRPKSPFKYNTGPRIINRRP